MRSLVFIALVLVTGCSSDFWERAEKRREERKRLEAIGLTNMLGHPVTTLVQLYGEPSSVTPLETGDTGYIWNNSYSYTPADPDLYLPKEQRKLKRAQEKQDHKDNTFWDSLVEGMFEDDGPETIHYSCKLGVTARNGVVTQANIQDSTGAQACSKFYSEWRVYQTEHPELFAAPAAPGRGPMPIAAPTPSAPGTVPQHFPSPFPKRPY